MNREDIIRMAREAGGMDGWGTGSKRSDPELSADAFVFDPDDVERLVQAAYAAGAAAEREACAEVADGFDACDPKHIAAAIRARGQA